MPGFDKTGPGRTGQMKGWGRGNCTPSDSLNSGSMTEDVQAGYYGIGRGGMPCGCGRGFGGGRMRRSSAGERGFAGRHGWRS